MNPIVKQITVDASQETAFRLFTEGIDRWWPKEHHIGASPSKEERIEPRVGGRWYSLNEDGSESNVGRVLVWDPFGRVVLTWQITGEWAFDPDFVTEVDVRFIPTGDRRTRVVLEHRHLERFGAGAGQMHGIFDSDEGWAKTLRAFASVADSAARTVAS